jgi:hypothetical protein
MWTVVGNEAFCDRRRCNAAMARLRAAAGA